MNKTIGIIMLMVTIFLCSFIGGIVGMFYNMNQLGLIISVLPWIPLIMYGATLSDYE